MEQQQGQHRQHPERGQPPAAAAGGGGVNGPPPAAGGGNGGNGGAVDGYRRSFKYRFQIFILSLLFASIIVLVGFERYLQFSLERRRKVKAINAEQRLKKNSNNIKNQHSTSTTSSSSSSSSQASSQTTKTTIKASGPIPIEQNHLYRSNRLAWKETRNVYWNRAVVYLNMKEWDPTLLLSSSSSNHNAGEESSTLFTVANYDDVASQDAINIPSSYNENIMSYEQRIQIGLEALQRAADAGHPKAQKYMANALATGFYPTTYQPPQPEPEEKEEEEETTSSSNINNNNNLLLNLHVQQDVIDPKSKQQQHAMLLWQMSSIGGDIESQTILVNRYEKMSATTTASDNKNNKNNAAAGGGLGCHAKLPYYQSIANGIVDELILNSNSRGKVTPVMDKHVLHQLHLFGGTQSKLDTHNQPDESEQALQFYHVRAMSSDDDEVPPESSSGDGGSGSGSTAHTSNRNSITTGSSAASYTLGHLYHYGLRGVPQNLTQALYYYEYAAKLGHWEAAGHAGDFYMHGIGTPNNGQQDAYQARKYFRMGIPFGVDGCRKRLEAKLASNPGKSSNNGQQSLCDSNCLNGMGMLQLMGLPIMVAVDQEAAEKHFQLAREQGNKDAAYHLAMLKLGWKQHFVSLEGLEHLQDGGQTQFGSKEDQFPTTTKKGGAPLFHPSHAEWATALSELATSAAGGHLLAKLRLGDMYANGVQVPHKGSTVHVIPKDCDKATKHYKWIADHASPYKSLRLRKAYKQYMAGNLAGSLRNYLIAAEAGSDVAQINAAFLLEQGECLGLSRVDCAKASVRLWKAAAAKGNAEASLRVGDFYYYGRLRSTVDADTGVSTYQEGVVGPFGFVQYILYPEKFIGNAWLYIERTMKNVISSIQERRKQLDGGGGSGSDDKKKEGVEKEAPACSADDMTEDGTCPASYGSSTSDKDDKSTRDAATDQHYDLEMSTKYYRMAAERSSSPRANYNLGFAYEWGLGLKQDFPLAKRHYDLAMDAGSTESELPISVALICLNTHESLVKLYMSWKDYWDALNDDKKDHDNTASKGGRRKGSRRHAAVEDEGEAVPTAARGRRNGRPVPGRDRRRRSSSAEEEEVDDDDGKLLTEQQLDVIMSHLLSWESLLLLILTIVLLLLHRTRRR